MVYVAVRLTERESVLGHVTPADPDLVPHPHGEYERVLVPLKLGPIGEEVLATAIKLIGGARRARSPCSTSSGCRSTTRSTRRCPRPRSSPRRRSRTRRSSRGEHGIELRARVVRARALGEAIVEAAVEEDADVVLMGSAPRWRRQSLFFSPTVDYVLRKAPCDVMVIAYPQGVLEEDEGITVAP